VLYLKAIRAQIIIDNITLEGFNPMPALVPSSVAPGIHLPPNEELTAAVQAFYSNGSRHGGCSGPRSKEGTRKRQGFWRFIFTTVWKMICTTSERADWQQRCPRRLARAIVAAALTQNPDAPELVLHWEETREKETLVSGRCVKHRHSNDNNQF
jgi:hypothetical protein